MARLPSNFEGPEKKLEIILTVPRPGLRANADRRWERVVAASGAEIISRISTNQLDAYLLSESSLFVWDDRVLLITCGQTTLVDAVPVLLGFLSRREIAWVFYERKNLLFPEEQPRDFAGDVRRLSEFFDGESGRLGPATEDHLHLFCANPAGCRCDPDVTLQILMNDLDPTVAAVFCGPFARDARRIEKETGIDRLVTHMRRDRYAFSPFGYSINGIRGRDYCTIHVTPQRGGSYASFETNMVAMDYAAAIDQVLSVFNPRRFSLVLTRSANSPHANPWAGPDYTVPGYCIRDRNAWHLKTGYIISFSNHIRHRLEIR